MQQVTQQCQKAHHNQIKAEDINQCQFCRHLCQQSHTLDSFTIINQLDPRSLKKFIFDEQQMLLKQFIKNANYEIKLLDNQQFIRQGVISNDLKYLVILVLTPQGDREELQIWDYQQYLPIKSISFNFYIQGFKFTLDSKILYVATLSNLFKFNVAQQFKYMKKFQFKNDSVVWPISCQLNNIIFTQHSDNFLSKIQLNKNKLIMKFQTHSHYDDFIVGLDYNKNLNLIAGGFSSGTIKLWNANNGSQMIEICDIFIINNDQLISLDSNNTVIIWNIQIQTKQLENYQPIEEQGQNINQVLYQQFILTTQSNFVRIYSIDGELIRQIDHNLMFTSDIKVIQSQSLKSILLLGWSNRTLINQSVFKIDFDI